MGLRRSLSWLSISFLVKLKTHEAEFLETSPNFYLNKLKTGNIVETGNWWVSETRLDVFWARGRGGIDLNSLVDDNQHPEK